MDGDLSDDDRATISRLYTNGILTTPKYPYQGFIIGRVSDFKIISGWVHMFCGVFDKKSVMFVQGGKSWNRHFQCTDSRNCKWDFAIKRGSQIIVDPTTGKKKRVLAEESVW